MPERDRADSSKRWLGATTTRIRSAASRARACSGLAVHLPSPPLHLTGGNLGPYVDSDLHPEAREALFHRGSESG